MSDIFIARQPIYTRDLDVHAYELLYRDGFNQAANVVDGDDATSQVLTNSLIEIGLPELVGTQAAFINCTEQFLLQGLPAPIAPDQVVLEVLEDILPGKELLESLSKLRSEGYMIALDDFVYDETKRPLVEQADLVKVDIMLTQNDQLEGQVDKLKEFDVELLAEKVETLEEFERCKELGFKYFQGYFFCRPHIVKGVRPQSSKLVIMKLLAEIQEKDISLDRLEALIANDVSLSYRILRYVNSAMFNLPTTVDSIKKAVSLVGLSAVKAWVTILSMSSIDDKPFELMRTALVRAKMCENLAKETNITPDSAFTVGLFSTLDALMDAKLEDLITELPFISEVNEALLSQTGKLGRLLKVVLAYERGDWNDTDDLDLKAPELHQAYLKSIRWAGEISSTLLSE